MPSRFAIIANPTSGRGRGEILAGQLREALAHAGHQARLLFTTRAGDAERIASDLCLSDPTPDVLVACGGDGTINQVVNALASTSHAKPILALAPAGRCNDFARALGIIPRLDPILHVLLHGTTLKLDLGQVNDRFFCTIATVGIDAAISSYVHRTWLPFKGRPAYLFAALRTLLRYRPPTLTLRGDFGEISKPVYLASTANTPSYGGAIRLVPQANPADGLLHACIVDAMTRRKALGMIPKVLCGQHPADPNVVIAPTRRLLIDSDQPLEVWADGELITHTPANLQVIPNAIGVLSPAPWLPK